MAMTADYESIRTRAYYKWLEAGSPEGDGAEFWQAAETELADDTNDGQAASQDGQSASQGDGKADRNDVAGGITTSGTKHIPDKEQIVGTRG